MELSSSAIKVIAGIGGASVVAIASGVGIHQNNRRTEAHLNKQVSDLKESVEKIATKTAFDEGLIKLLKDGGDIIFNLFQGTTKENSTTPLNNNSFPKNGNFIVTAYIDVSSKSNQIKGDPQNINILKRLNNDKNWKWECKIQFSLQPAHNWTLVNKEKIFSDSENTLFNSLKRDLLKKPDEKAKERKIKFIENCASLRHNNQQLKKQTSLPGGKATAWTNFYVKEKNSGQQGGNAYLMKKDKPWEWFGGEEREWETVEG